MAKKKVSSGAPGWVVTFGDMMSLLLCFFIVLLSFSVMDQQKFAEAAGSLEKAFGSQKERPLVGSPHSDKMVTSAFDSVPLEVRFQQDLIEIIDEEIKGGLVEVEEQEEGLVLRIQEVVAFDSGSAAVKPDFVSFLDKLGKGVAELNARVIVSGHTDDLPLRKGGGFESNWSLSAARAISIVEFWAARYNIPAERLAAVGHAQGRPVAANTTPEGRARNRRVEFKIMPGQAVAFEGLPVID